MLYLICSLLAVAIVALDQISKALVRAAIPLGGYAKLLPGVMHFTYVQNTGAAFSSLMGQRWLLVALTAVFLAVMVLIFVKKWISHPFGLICLAAVAGGGVGNLIDRIRFGYVTDMFATDFIDFAVFNVADIFIVGGCIGLFVYAIFLAPKEEKAKNREEENP